MGLPSDGSVLPLRSAVLTSTRCPQEKLKHLAKQAGPPGPAPGGLGSGFRGNSRTSARATSTSGSARRGARSCPGDGGARTRTRGAESAAASVRAFFSLRAASPALGARRPLPGSRRDGLARAPLARSPAPPPPRTRHGPAPALCAGAAGRGSIRAFPQPSGGRSGCGGRSFSWPGGGRQATGERGAESRGRTGSGCGPGAGLVLLWRRARSSRNPEMHLHQVLTGAVNPGDNCYSVGSVGDVPFTVSRAGASRRAASDGPTHAPWALGGGGGRMRDHRPRPPARPVSARVAGGGDGRFGAAPGSAVPGGRCWQRPKPGAASTCSWLAANGLGLRVWRRCCSLGLPSSLRL